VKINRMFRISAILLEDFYLLYCLNKAAKPSIAEILLL
jgi:hypothetical protein